MCYLLYAAPQTREPVSRSRQTRQETSRGNQSAPYPRPRQSVRQRATRRHRDRGGDDSLSQRQPYGPQGIRDQSGPGHSLKAGAHDAIDGRAERNAAEFKAAQAAASGVADAGATGARVAAAGQLVTLAVSPPTLWTRRALWYPKAILAMRLMARTAGRMHR